MSAFSLLLWLDVFHKFRSFNGPHVTPFSFLGIVLAGSSLLVSIGVMIRRETARLLHLCIAGALLAFSGYTTYWYIDTIGTYEQAIKGFTVNIERDIKRAQESPQLSPQQKEAYIKPLQVDEAFDKWALAQGKKIVWAVASGYVGAVVPLVFLTRQRIKDGFLY